MTHTGSGPSLLAVGQLFTWATYTPGVLVARPVGIVPPSALFLGDTREDTIVSIEGVR